MNITTVRKISQFFFVLLFLWFCFVLVIGDRWWQLRGWPVNLFIHLDLLTAIGTVLTTGKLFAGLLWGLITAIATILVGRIFCGWVCPFGALHQFIGYLGKINKPLNRIIDHNQYHPLQQFKYWILIFFLASPFIHWFGQNNLTSLQIGWLDPIPLLHRSINLVLLPIVNWFIPVPQTIPRYYDQAVSIGIIFLIAVLMNLVIPRFFCRFVCPLGALLGVLSRFALWRIVNKSYISNEHKCHHCRMCEKDCEGASSPSEKIRIPECVMCMNCLHQCRHDLIVYDVATLNTQVYYSPNLSKRGFIVSFVTGIVAVPLMRLNGYVGPNWNSRLIRPPGAISEDRFLTVCIKCGQCMKICPTNVIQPAGSEFGIEAMWTPVLNFRIGTSGCQRNCIACSHICPTGAIRPLSLDEKIGRNQFQEKGPIKIGTAFVDQSRCLPWAMGKPCIVCQENCPVSPKAIQIHNVFMTLDNIGTLIITDANETSITFQTAFFRPNQLATGDYFCIIKESDDKQPRRIISNTPTNITIAPDHPFKEPLKNKTIDIQIKLQRPYVNPDRCIGCGVCEHECPVSGKRAIRITAENETRNREHAIQ